MPLRAGDTAPNPTLEGPDGPAPLFQRSNRKLVILLFGPGEPPVGWTEVVEEAERSEGELLAYRIRPGEGQPQPGVRIDAACEAHRRFDAYDWSTRRPTPGLVAFNNAGMIRLASGSLEEGIEPLKKIIASHLERVRLKKGK